jgi:hypothetical protein
LPVYSVGSDEEARRLVAMACKMNHAGQYFAPELADDQSLGSLENFARRLNALHDVLVANRQCDCTGED